MTDIRRPRPTPAADGLARRPVMLVPAGFSFQPVDVADVAGRLAGLAGGGPGGRVPDMGGPQVRTASELALAWLRASGRHRPLLPPREQR